ncbi:hypothetical protein TEQG_04349 [Trichophyton equinum CBS 127.97]|uniref:Uncharacterized protein n=1 Tax=Trichophyton equinum (strain ATCC MYA-4606 / CBS 127.97) TaxID=559882 RepID=F2PTH3_TRIEC|nr:hypothetical protein TEQG_04349 [Trichophyton equinum CBS 127.97]
MKPVKGQRGQKEKANQPRAQPTSTPKTPPTSTSNVDIDIDINVCSFASADKLRFVGFSTSLRRLLEGSVLARSRVRRPSRRETLGLKGQADTQQRDRRGVHLSTFLSLSSFFFPLSRWLQAGSGCLIFRTQDGRFEGVFGQHWLEARRAF